MYRLSKRRNVLRSSLSDLAGTWPQGETPSGVNFLPYYVSLWCITYLYSYSLEQGESLLSWSIKITIVAPMGWHSPRTSQFNLFVIGTKNLNLRSKHLWNQGQIAAIPGGVGKMQDVFGSNSCEAVKVMSAVGASIHLYFTITSGTFLFFFEIWPHFWCYKKGEQKYLIPGLTNNTIVMSKTR